MKVLIPWNFNMLRNVPVALVQADPVLKGFFFFLLFKLRKVTLWVKKLL